LFETNLRDERYLPFEGAGAIESVWRLELPARIRQFDYDTISDVILHIRYTARDGGKALKDAAVTDVSQRLATAELSGMVRLFSVRHEFPSAWAKFKAVNIGGAVKTAELRLDLRAEHYPFWSKGRLGGVARAEVIAKTGGQASNIDIVERSDGQGKIDTLTGATAKGLLQGTLTNLKPTSPVSEPQTPLKLFFKQNDLTDLWIAIAWTEITQ
jgi:hypothetical protein